jgi:hypothetical protein
VRRLGFGLVALLAPVAAAAQSFPQCGPTVAVGGGLAASDVMRQLRCTIAVLDQERMTAVDAETQARVAMAMAQSDASEAKATAATAQKALADLKVKEAKEAKDLASFRQQAKRRGWMRFLPTGVMD